MKKQVLVSLMLAGLTIPALSYGQINEDHHQAYLAALDVVEHAETRIANAMEQVQSGQVAHYDFLQNEHIELVRHARALAWPPGVLAENERSEISAEAKALLASADDLEWVIADFLKAMAQVRSASSNTLDIASNASAQSSGALKESLNTLQVNTLLFMASSYSENWPALSESFDTVLNADITEQTRRELQFQKERLALFAPQLQQQHQALLDADVDVHARSLKALYEAAT